MANSPFNIFTITSSLCLRWTQRVIGLLIHWIGGTGESSVKQLFPISDQHLCTRQVFGKGPRKLELSLMEAEQAADVGSDFNALIAQRRARQSTQ